MKYCTLCQAKYEDNISFCATDGEVLEDDPSSFVGSVLDGQYQIESLLGKGGMGAVYLARHILLFGRRKVAMMVLVGASIGWAAELAVMAASGGSYQPWSGFNAITLIVPGLLANDAERQGPERTVWGVTLATLVVLAGMGLLEIGIHQLGPLLSILQGPVR